jgi:hypothetical protein
LGQRGSSELAASLSAEALWVVELGGSEWSEGPHEPHP